jgi:tetratricopeptide (TPR) repeat protein
MRTDYPLGSGLSGFIRAKAGWLSGRNDSSLVRGWLHHCRFQSSLSLSCQAGAREELDKMSSLPGLPPALELEYLFDVCNLANQFSLWDLMTPALDKLALISNDLGYTRGLAQTDYFRAVLLINEGQYRRAIDLYQSAAVHARSAGDRHLEAETYNDLGFCHSRLKESDSAMDYYRRSMAIREQDGDLAGQAESLSNIGLVLCRGKDHRQAGDFFNRALDLQSRIGDKIGTGYTLVNLGFLAEDLKDFGQGEKYYMRALDIRQEIGDVLGLALCYLRLGHLSHRRRARDRTLGLLDQSIASFRKAEDAFGQIEAGLFKAQYLLDYGDRAGAGQAAELLSRMIDESSSEAHHKRYRQLLDRIKNSG